MYDNVRTFLIFEKIKQLCSRPVILIFNLYTPEKFPQIRVLSSSAFPDYLLAFSHHHKLLAGAGRVFA